MLYADIILLLLFHSQYRSSIFEPTITYLIPYLLASFSLNHHLPTSQTFYSLISRIVCQRYIIPLLQLYNLLNNCDWYGRQAKLPGLFYRSLLCIIQASVPVRTRPRRILTSNIHPPHHSRLGHVPRILIRKHGGTQQRFK